MKPFVALLALATVAGLSACDSRQQDAVENTAENQAEKIDDMADKLEQSADNVGTAVDNQVDALKEKAEDVRDDGEAAKEKLEGK